MVMLDEHGKQVKASREHPHQMEEQPWGPSLRSSDVTWGLVANMTCAGDIDAVSSAPRD